MKKQKSEEIELRSVIERHPLFKKIRGEFIRGKRVFLFSGISSGVREYILEVLSKEFSGSFILTTNSKCKYQEINSESNRDAILQYLESFGFERVDFVEKKGEFSIMGDSMTLWGKGYSQPSRIEFWGDSVESISLIDEVSKRKTRSLTALILLLEEGEIIFPEEKFSGVIAAPVAHESKLAFDFTDVPAFHSSDQLLKKYVDSTLSQGMKIMIATIRKKMLPEFPESVVFSSESVSRGFKSKELGVIVLGDFELFDTIIPRKSFGRKEDFIEIQSIEVGNYIVHKNHGIAVYGGIEVMESDGGMLEYFVLKYAKGDKLFVPCNQLGLLTKYVGAGKIPRLTRLGTQDWERVRKKVKKAIKSIAGELLQLYALREMRPGHKFSKDSSWQKQLEKSFPFEETEDQTRTWQEIKSDMESKKPMDRLIIGDVGFGKTELAIRAAFKATQDGKQVVLLAPTTVLVEQHYSVFKERLKEFPVDVVVLSRFKSKDEISRVLNRVETGVADIVIGTHRVLSSDVKLKDLGLLIIDEEQRFGVTQKERLKQFRAEVDVLSMSATPIPRSLSMALSGIKDVSMLVQPPKGRQPIKTYFGEFSYNEVVEIIEREVVQGGQVYLVHNNIRTIESFTNELRKKSPSVRFVVGHGQMHGDSLAIIMREFNSKRYDVLVCTTIIENGIDMPNVNTIIIDDAHRFGLSQLHQLRGRVGRSSRKSYCYMFYPKGADLSSISCERMEAVQEAQELGAGFRITTKDLELRGAGNLLGREQSGSIYVVGYALYVQLLKEQVQRLRKLNMH